MTATQQPPVVPPSVSSPTVNRPIRRSRLPLVDLYKTAVGKKWVMALSGIALLGFVFAHMFGNLKMYAGAAELDAYADGLRTLLYPIMPKEAVLWLMRVGLLVAFVAHIHSAYSLTMMNRRARPQGYSERDYIAASWAARTMRYTGTLVLLFVLWHLADLTFGWVNPDFVYGNVYDNVVATLSRLPVAIFYIVANVALGVHLYHGIWSVFQSVGSMSPKFNPRHNPLRKGAAALFVIVTIGANISFPLAVQFGIVGG